MKNIRTDKYNEVMNGERERGREMMMINKCWKIRKNMESKYDEYFIN